MRASVKSGHFVGLNLAPCETARRRGLDPYEIALVFEKRALRASWDACAAMIGRSAHDVRLVCDKSYGQTPQPEVGTSDASRPEPVRRPPPAQTRLPTEAGQIKSFTLQCGVLVAIADGFTRSVQIAGQLDRAFPQISDLTATLSQKGLIERTIDCHWALTRAGVVEVARLKEAAWSLKRETDLMRVPHRKRANL